MRNPTRILLQTTIPFTEDDWHIGRFSLLTGHLRSLKNADESPLYEVTARNRETDESGNDPLSSTLDESDYDQLWLFALDLGDGLTSEDCAGITRFRQRGGGILSARDHNDMGSSLCTLGGIGAAHYFHSKQPGPDDTRNRRDDDRTLNIDWPNYHSGANGDFQNIDSTDHPLMKREDGSLIEYFPAHPHEGGIGVPNESARVVATGTSKTTGRDFIWSLRSKIRRTSTVTTAAVRSPNPAFIISSITIGTSIPAARHFSKNRRATSTNECRKGSMT